jgi:hypothetical protein
VSATVNSGATGIAEKKRKGQTRRQAGVGGRANGRRAARDEKRREKDKDKDKDDREEREKVAVTDRVFQLEERVGELQQLLEKQTVEDRKREMEWVAGKTWMQDCERMNKKIVEKQRKIEDTERKIARMWREMKLVIEREEKEREKNRELTEEVKEQKKKVEQVMDENRRLVKKMEGLTAELELNTTRIRMKRLMTDIQEVAELENKRGGQAGEVEEKKRLEQREDVRGNEKEEDGERHRRSGQRLAREEKEDMQVRGGKQQQLGLELQGGQVEREEQGAREMGRRQQRYQPQWQYNSHPHHHRPLRVPHVHLHPHPHPFPHSHPHPHPGLHPRRRR